MAGQGHGDLGIRCELQCRTSIPEAPPTLSQGHPLSSHPCAPCPRLVIPLWRLPPLLELIGKSPSRFLRGTRTLRSRQVPSCSEPWAFLLRVSQGDALEAFLPGGGGWRLPPCRQSSGASGERLELEARARPACAPAAVPGSVTAGLAPAPGLPALIQTGIVPPFSHEKAGQGGPSTEQAKARVQVWPRPV